MLLTLERLPAVLKRYPRSRSAFYEDQKRGLMPPPVSLGVRCSAYPTTEIDKVLEARVAGKSDDEIRELVARLVAQRKEVA
jgi:prophage regulatory protein